jgi:fumarate hydratase class I
LPGDIKSALQSALKRETIPCSRQALTIILENIRIAQERQRPLCQDTGVPVFFVQLPFGESQRELMSEIAKATRVATKVIPLRANAVDVLSERNSGNNTGIGIPVVYFKETRNGKLIIDLMLKGAGSENVGQLYKLPDEELTAERDLSGVRKCVLDAVFKAQGRGCPPYVIGVGVGATKDQVTKLAKEQLLRKIDSPSRQGILDRFERKTLSEINRLGIGPLGFGGKTTALGVKIGLKYRHPASYFVDVSISCWADRRARLIWSESNCRIIN